MVALVNVYKGVVALVNDCWLHLYYLHRFLPYCGNNPVMNIDSFGTVWWNPFSWSAEIWMHIGSAIAVIGGIALMFVPGGQMLGLGLIGAGVGSFIGGNISEMNGGSFAQGWAIGGLIGLGLGLGLGAALPYISTFLSTSFTLWGTGGGLALATGGTIGAGIVITGAEIAALGALVTIMMFATQRMGPGRHSNNQAENKFIDYLQKKYNLTNDQRRILHDEITGKGYLKKAIEEILKWLFNK